MKKNILRIVDANANRAREGLRVCEDICRFILDAGAETRQFKKVRHAVTAALLSLGIGDAVSARAIETDVGRKSIPSEQKRKDMKDVFFANVQRAKESVRVLEEFAKISAPQTADDLKRARYAIYAVEKKVAAKL